MNSNPILVLSGSPESGLEIAGVDAKGTAPIIVLGWDEVEAELPGLAAVSGVLCEEGEDLASRRGLLEILRRAYPHAPIVSFSRGPCLADDDSAEVQSREMGFDAHLRAPLNAANLRLFLARENRLRSLARRHRQALVQLREQAEKLDLLIETAKAANSLLEPRLVMQLLMSRLQELVQADSWSLSLLVDASTGCEIEVLRGDRTGKVRTFRTESQEGLAAQVIRDRKPVLVHEAGNVTGSETESERVGRSVLCIPLVSRGKAIGALELMSGPSETDPRLGERELELIGMIMEPTAITIENAILFKRLEELSVTDDLTRLYNSRYLNTVLGREIKRARRYGQSVSVIFLDLDGFKVINDTHGHLAGSRALAEVGRLLKEKARETDVVSRYGGDEFTLVMPHTGSKDAFVVAERLRTELERHVFLQSMGLAVRITASFGIASFPEHGESREELISQSDQAMYRVKERSKNGVEVALLAVALDGH